MDLGQQWQGHPKELGKNAQVKDPLLAEVHDLKGLEAPLPHLLGEAITFMGHQNNTFFLKVATAFVWTNGSTGTKEFIMTKAVVCAVQANIDQRLPHGQKLHTLAHLALEASASFVVCFVAFIEENCKSYALLNYPYVFVCPQVMTPEWRKQLHKAAADIIFTVPVGHPAWPKVTFEPLLIGIVFPFTSDMTLGSSETPQICMQWSASCVVRGQRGLIWKAHLFRANFASSVGVWKKCLQVWCPECYICLPTRNGR
jgi:hypothetical protein